MELFFAIGQLIAGIYMTLVGFKVINLFKGKNEQEKEEQWYKKFGVFFKYGGIVLVLLAIFQLVI
jgi:hypothetical protein